MLNSIKQQNGEIPEITISISHSVNNGNPTTESVIDFFRQNGLNIVDVVLKTEEMCNRSIARNMRLKETDADWILFADSDLVYDNNFFSLLKKKTESQTYANEKRVIGADRYSLNDKFCIEFFEKDDRKYPCIIENVAEIPKKFPVKTCRGGGTAAGYFQLAKVSSMKERNMVYSGRNRDFWRNTKSDREFRVRMGGRISINEPDDRKNGVEMKMYHLNHDRGGPDIQR